MVHLQRQRLARANHDALDLEAWAFFQHGVQAPGAGHGAVQPVGIVALVLELLGDELDLLAARGIGDQQGIRGVDDDQVVQTDGTDQPSGRVYIAVAHVVQHRFAVAVVAGFVALA
ncbi:hypothetical protein D3C80_1754660 [compost metagenome]